MGETHVEAPPALDIIDWIVGLPEYRNRADTPSDRRKKKELSGAYGANNGNIKVEITEAFLLKVRRSHTTQPLRSGVARRSGASAEARNDDVIEVPERSELYIFSSFIHDGKGEPRAARESRCVATLFLPGGKGQVSVYTTLRCAVRNI
jgi:hypothetical protein